MDAVELTGFNAPHLNTDGSPAERSVSERRRSWDTASRDSGHNSASSVTADNKRETMADESSEEKYQLINRANGSVSRDENGELPIGILGIGNYGTALAKRCQLAGVKFVLGSRYAGTYTDDSVEVLPYVEVASSCSVILLAIPRHAYDATIPGLEKQLAGKTVVDISNLENRSDSPNALHLQSLLPKSYVVKALNTVSAYTLEHDAYGATRDTFVCGDNRTSREQVMQFCRDIGLNPVDRGRLNSAVAIERLPFRFFDHWGTAFIITVCTLAVQIFYSYLRFFWADKKELDENKDHIPLYYSNRMIAWLTLSLLSLTYLPGCLAGFIQLAWGTKYRSFPNWLDRWMKCRKQLGLICLMLGGLHGCLSCILMGAEYIKYMQVKVPIPGTDLYLLRHISITAEISILFAGIAMTLMSVVGVTSLPSVNARMSWKEWDFIQRGVGFATLLFATLHVLVYMHSLWDPNYEFKKFWPKNMPPDALLMPILPVIVIGLKLLLLLPGVVCRLNNIRSGRVGNTKRKLNKVALA